MNESNKFPARQLMDAWKARSNFVHVHVLINGYVNEFLILIFITRAIRINYKVVVIPRDNNGLV